MKKLVSIIAMIVLAIFIQGCAVSEVHQMDRSKSMVKVENVNSDAKYYSINTTTTTTITDSVDKIAKQLLSTMKIKPNLEAIAITSFVDLHQLNKTTYFGRVLSESFFNELHSRGFLVADFRGQKTLVVNAGGEFFLSRDIKKLNNKVATKYVLVGTYSKIEEGVIINARIIDNETGIVLSSSRVVHHTTNCEIFENCPKKTLKKTSKTTTQTVKRTIGLSTDGCSTVSCPNNCVDLDCGEKNNYKPNKVNLKKMKKKYCDYK